MYTLFDVERITRIHEAALYNEGMIEGAANAEKAFAEREAEYLSEMAALKARLAQYE